MLRVWITVYHFNLRRIYRVVLDYGLSTHQFIAFSMLETEISTYEYLLHYIAF
jgi:hypothetical protein